MCGIFAAFSLYNTTTDIDLDSFLLAASSLLKNRGPDHFGYSIDKSKGAFLCHSRLAIQGDDELSNQPYRCRDTSIVLYNGEIYNVHDLPVFNDSYHGTSDTPIFSELVASNPSLLSDVEGMFAFVHYRRQDNTVLLGRDIFGEKPLFYLLTQTTLFIFSDILYSSLISYWGLRQPALDISTVKRFVAYGYRQTYSESEGLSFFRDIKCIKPGTLATIHLATGSLQSQSFYNLESKYSTIKELTTLDQERIEHSLKRSISQRCVSDASTASALSGGIDSSLVTSILSSTINPPALCLTIDSKDHRYNETQAAKTISDTLDLPHHPINILDITPSESPVARFLNLSISRGSPFLTLTSFVSTYIYQQARLCGHKVVFSGAGADELFTGYYDYFFYRMNASDYTNSEASSFEKHILPYITNPIMSRGISALPEVNLQKHHYCDFLAAQSLSIQDLTPPKPKQTRFKKSTSSSTLRWRMFQDLTSEVIPIILHEDDLNSMHYSVENRSPFLSKSLFEESLHIPERQYMYDAYQKHPLRTLLAKTIPATIAFSRRKVGFNYSFRDFSASDQTLYETVMRADTVLWTLFDKKKTLDRILAFDLPESLAFRLFSVQAFLLGSLLMKPTR